MKTRLLINLTKSIESSKSLKEFISSAMSILNELDLPVFNINLIVQEKGGDFLLVHVDYGRLKKLLPDFAFDNPDSEIINLKLLMRSRQPSSKSIIFSLMREKIVKTENVLLEDGSLPFKNFEKKQFLRDFISLSPTFRAMEEKYGLNTLVKNPDIGGIISFPVLCDQRVIGSLDLLLPPDRCVMKHEKTRLLPLVTGIIGNGYKNFIYRDKASLSASKYQAIFDSTPLAMFVVDHDHQIVEANNRFKEWHPRYQEGRENICYRVLPASGSDTPCPDCMVGSTFQTGRETSREISSYRNGSQVNYKIVTSPILSETGEIAAVMEIMEDITSRAIAEKKLEKHSIELETEIGQKIRDAGLKAKNMTVLVNTVQTMRIARNINESIDTIFRGYQELGTGIAAFALFDPEKDDIIMARIHPESVSWSLAEIFLRDVTGIRMSRKKYPDNPFVQSCNIGRTIVYKGEEEVSNFLRACFLKNSEGEIKKAAALFSGMSLILFPLMTQSMSEGAIAIFAPIDLLEQNYEYYQFLSHSAAVEINRQKNSERLSRSESKYRNLVESSHDMILLSDREGNIKYYNTTFKEKTGLPPVDGGDLNFYSLFPPASKDKLREIIPTGTRSNFHSEPVEIRMNTPRREELWVEMIINLVSIEDSDFQIVARDITRRKNLELVIGNLTAFQEKILQNDYIGIISMDLEGRITSWNRGAVNILEYSLAEVLQKDIRDLMAPGGGGKDSLAKRNLKEGYQFSREIRMVRKTGTLVTIMYVESLMKDESGESMALIAFFFDISEKVKLEARWKELNHRLSQAQLITIVSLAKLAEYRDIETGLHLERIMKFTELTARELSSTDQYKNYITEEYIVDLVNSSPLHDIGKVGIPDYILHKTGSLTPEEFEIMKRHTIIGGDTIAEAEKKVKGRSYLNLGKEIAYYHHERWDGSGYPKGLKQDGIPLSARIVAVADVYDALTSRRPYKEAFTHRNAVDIISKNAATHFDAAIVKAFIQCEKNFVPWKKKYS